MSTTRTAPLQNRVTPTGEIDPATVLEIEDPRKRRDSGSAGAGAAPII